MSEPAREKGTMGDQGEGNGFVAGFASRLDQAAAELHARRRGTPAGFTPADLIARIEQAFGARSPAPANETGKPKHFSPADREANPTQGWDLMDPDAIDETQVDPTETAYARGYDEGVAEARAAMAVEVGRDRALVTALAEELREVRFVDREAMAARLRQTVLHLVSALVGEIGVSPTLLNARVEAAAELLADQSESAIVRLHPDDVPLVDGRLPDTIFAVGDSSVSRGAFVLEAASTIVEDGPVAWLDQLASAIDKVPVPKAPAPQC